MNPLPRKAQWVEAFRVSLTEGSFVKATLGAPASANGPRKLLLRPVMIRGERQCSAVSRYATRDETKNHPLADAATLVDAALGGDFLSAHLFTTTQELQWERRDGKERLKTIHASHPLPALGHDRLRQRRVDVKAPFLAELGVTNASGTVRERMGDKFRQIERFVDLLASAWRESALSSSPSQEPLTLADMGSGKGYLTFAAADYFERGARVPVEVTGVEARPELVALCNGVARRCGFERLRFVQSRIGEFPLPRVDILIALHACDTATDEALAAGVKAGTEIILAAPCCHKEVGVENGGALKEVLRHGLFAERHAEMATDALRALLLERAGYRVRVAEFVAAEHTAKNVMLIATRRGGKAPMREAFNERISALKAFYGIGRQTLETLLGD